MYICIMKINNIKLYNISKDIDFNILCEKFVGKIRREEIPPDKRYGFNLNIYFEIYYIFLQIYGRKILYINDYRRNKIEAIKFIRYHSFSL